METPQLSPQLLSTARRWTAMSTLVTIIGTQTIAFAADSLHVELNGQATTTSTGYKKLVRVGNRMAGFVGVASANGWHLNTALAAVLGDAPKLSMVVPLLCRDHGDQIRTATDLWRSQFGDDSCPSAIYLAERTPSGLHAQEWIWTTNAHTGEAGYAGESLYPERSWAYVTLAGMFDDQAARYASGYRLDQLTATLTRTRPALPSPIGTPVDIPAQPAEQLARDIVEGIVARCGGRAHLSLDGWPEGIPLVSGPIESIAL